MSLFGKVLKGAGKVAFGVASEVVSQAKKSSYQNANQSGKTIAGKTVREWDKMWRPVGTLNSINLTPYNKSVGLYRAKLNGKIMYVGRAIEWNNGGFRKCLSDYTRESDSSRKHGSGQRMYENRHKLSIDFLIVGSTSDAAKVTAFLEGIMVGKYDPPWNKIKNFS